MKKSGVAETNMKLIQHRETLVGCVTEVTDGFKVAVEVHQGLL